MGWVMMTHPDFYFASLGAATGVAAQTDLPGGMVKTVNVGYF